MEWTMKFFKENSSSIFRLIITHIGMCVFGLVIFLATNLKGDTTMLIASIFSLIFFGAIVYTTMWEYGAKDKPAIDAGRLAFKPMNAFYSALVAEALGILIIIVYFVSSNFIEINETAKQIYAISYLILYLAESCASGLMLYFQHLLENPLVNSLCLLVCPLTVAISSLLGYSFGAKGVQIIPKKEKK